MRDDRGLDRADLDRHLTTQPEGHDVDGCDDPECIACSGLPDGLPDAAVQLFPLRSQVRLTANALKNLANDMDKNGRDIPERYIRAIREHAADLEKASA